MDLSFMNEEQFKPFVKRYLESLEFKVFEIPKKQGVLTPDFEAIGKNNRYTIELKIKGDDLEEITRDSEILSSGEVLSKSVPLCPRNTLSGIIEHGVKQLIEHDPKGDTFRIIWLHCGGQYPSLHDEKFHSTLFGTERLISRLKPGIVTCYYFYESAFYTWRNQLEGAILTHEKKARLCINSLSPRIELFRKSQLVAGMSEGLCDPKIEEIHDNAMIADCNFDRRRPNEVLRYLLKKYRLDNLGIIPMERHIVAMGLPTMDEQN